MNTYAMFAESLVVVALNPIPGGGGVFKVPPQGFLVPVPKAARVKAHIL